MFGFGKTVGIDGTGRTTELGIVDGRAQVGAITAVVDEITKTQTPVGAYDKGTIAGDDGSTLVGGKLVT